ncbi:LytR/AlgR family response regulator transcription factor [Roseivirga sp.]|uniref:LytR/AlgR family response regulator transcription factor n=1 Tax=Roseivirga sp. TaxID=1964215 RepID=UPI003B8B0315
MRQFTAIIVDDELNNRENLFGLLSKYCPKIEIIGQASSVVEAKTLINTTSPEVVFLDIEMPGANGFSLLEHFPNQNFQVIFITAYDSYALKAIKFSALDYILKPIDKEELIGAVEKIKSLTENDNRKLKNLGHFLNGETKKIALSLIDEVRLIDIDKIVRIEADNNYSTFVLQHGERIIVSKNLGHFYDLLKDHGFSRVHQSHLINQKFLERYVRKDGGYLVMENQDEVPVSRTQKQNVAKLFSSL